MSNKKKGDKSEASSSGEENKGRDVDLEAIVLSLAESVSKMQRELSGKNDRQNVSHENVSVSKQYISLWRELGGQNLIFYEKSAQHPISFINKISKLFEQAEVPENERVGMAINCLRGSAADWATYRESGFKNFEEFRESFKKRYWGDKEERELYNEIQYGQHKSGSLSEYFLKLVNQSRYLSAGMTENELVTKLAKHFSDEVRRGIIINGFKKIEEIEDYLKQIDAVSGGSRDKNWRRENNQRRTEERTERNKENLQENRDVRAIIKFSLDISNDLLSDEENQQDNSTTLCPIITTKIGEIKAEILIDSGSQVMAIWVTG